MCRLLFLLCPSNLVQRVLDLGRRIFDQGASGKDLAAVCCFDDFQRSQSVQNVLHSYLPIKLNVHLPLPEFKTKRMSWPAGICPGGFRTYEI